MRDIAACIPARYCRKKDITFDQATYKQRHQIENMFARIKDWRHIHTRNDRCAQAFPLTIAATVSYWL